LSGRYPLVDAATANPTLVYELLTALIAGVYAGAVLVPEQVFGGMRGDPPTWMRSPPLDPTTGGSLPMPADPHRPHQPDSEQRWPACVYLDVPWVWLKVPMGSKWQSNVDIALRYKCLANSRIA
jgi:hypothetical protein